MAGRATAARIARDWLLTNASPEGWPLAFSRDAHVLFWREFYRAGGLVLNPKFWNIEAGAADAVAAAIETGLVNGWSADKALSQFVYGGTAADAVRDPYGDWQLGGSTAYGRMTRLFVAETNRAHAGAWQAQQLWNRRRNRD